MNWQSPKAKFRALVAAVAIVTTLVVPVAGQLGGAPFSADRVRFQQQAAFGYSNDLDFEVRRRGIPTYIAMQLDSSPTTPTFPFPTTALQPSVPRPICNGVAEAAADPADPVDVPENCFRDTYSMHPIQQWFIKEATYGNAQLRLRVAWALSQIWVISGNEIKQSRHMTEYFKILYKHALGTPGQQGEDYFNLMKDMTLNAGMGDYLDMAVNTKINRNENYARELLQLFTTGVDRLDANGVVIVNGQRVPVYDQAIVENFAKVFTGWSFCNDGCTNSSPGTVNFIDPMVLTPGNHNLDAKSLLPLSTNGTINACTACGTPSEIQTYANNSLEAALRNVFNHPNVPYFVSRLLIQHLVMSEPPNDYVARVANKFIDNGSGVRGDMKEVVRAILLDPEARGDSKVGVNDGKYGKLKEPVQFAVNILRAFNAKGTDNSQSDGVIFTDPTFLKMGQNPFYAPSVFSYYSPNNKIQSGTVSAPEFGLMTAVTAVSRLNFANTLAFAGLPNTQPPPSPPSTYSTYLDFSEMEAIETADPTHAELILALNRRLMHGTMTAATQNAILIRLNGMAANSALERAKEAVYLAITSAQFQIQR